MLSNRGIAIGARLAPVLVATAALTWNATAQVQTTSPLSSTGSTFGGGFGGSSGGTGNLTGSSFTGSSFTGTGTSFSGGFGMTGSTSGGTFTGSSIMNSSNRGFSGNWNFSGGNRGTSATGGYGAAGAYGSGATGSGAGSSFSPYYFNPLAAGAPNVTSPPNFTSTIFSGSATGAGQGGYGLGSVLGGNPFQPANLSTNAATSGTTGARRIGYYTVSPGFDRPPTVPAQLQAEVERVLARSTALSPNRNIRVAVDGPAVVLRGTVPNEQDRRLAEALIRFTPGVYEVRNELEVPGTTPGQ
jgi:hypothetical protein